MKSFFAVVGFWFCLMFMLGSFNFIDFHVCAKEPGACSNDGDHHGKKTK